MDGPTEAQANGEDGLLDWGQQGRSTELGARMLWSSLCSPPRGASGGWDTLSGSYSPTIVESMNHVRASLGRDLYLKAGTLTVADVCFRGNGFRIRG